MATLHPKSLKSQAQARLSCADRDPRQLVLIYTGVLLLLNLLTSGLSLYLDQQIGDTGGLSGLGTRSVLQSLQTFLQYGTMFFSPFWQAGFVLVCLRWAQGQTPGKSDLLSGFGRVGAVLGHQLLLFALLFAVGMACGYVASTIFLFTPLSDSLVTAIEPLASGELMSAASLTAADAAEWMPAVLPLLVIYLVILIPVVVFFAYSLRLTTYFIMGPSRLGAIAAVLASFRAMRGNRLKMLKLDLSFWWFYLLEILLAFVCYLDVLLPLLGFTLPFNATVAYLIALVLYCVLELLLSLWMKARVDTTYALAFQAITTPPSEE